MELILLSGITVDFIMGYPFSKDVGYQILIVIGLTTVLLAVSTFINLYGEKRRKAKEKGRQVVDTEWKTDFIEPKKSMETI